jgi:nitroimidazol reductase NimA-like FMN-containing flavoprotein (pyridoxamine 5'-phosphate oxidase superfamily)
MASTAMSRAEREAFLSGVHVGVISLADGARGALTVPIWYGYEPGDDLWIITERDSRKGKLLVKLERFSLCAQTESPPYKYVSIEGPIVALERADRERHGRVMAHRYLGKEGGDAYIAATSSSESSYDNSIVVRMRPERWLCVDYAKMYGG